MAESKNSATDVIQKHLSALPEVLDSHGSQSRLNNANLIAVAEKAVQQEELQPDDLKQCSNITESIKKGDQDVARMPSKVIKARRIRP